MVHGDITGQQVDAIVNAANRALAGGGGVDAAIHRAAGIVMYEECRALRQTPEYRDGLPTGQAVATSGGSLPAKWVIHTVGPIYAGAAAALDQAELLRACYVNSLAVADRLGARSIAFPLISAGAYRWPPADAVEQALAALRGSATAVRSARLVLFDVRTFELADRLLR